MGRLEMDCGLQDVVGAITGAWGVVFFLRYVGRLALAKGGCNDVHSFLFSSQGSLQREMVNKEMLYHGIAKFTGRRTANNGRTRSFTKLWVFLGRGHHHASGQAGCASITTYQRSNVINKYSDSLLLVAHCDRCAAVP
jgi:hypothetical protein